MKIGFIGYQGFAKKLSSLFRANDLVEDIVYFHPTKILAGVPFSNDLKDLLQCKAIIIASPDHTHGHYLRQLQDYQGYIFCEKIPVTSQGDVDFLRKQANRRLYFDFNYRQSPLFDLLQNNVDQVLHISHRMSFGLALNESYKDNWRSHAKNAPLGVFQLSGIHFLDLLMYFFGVPTSFQASSQNISPYGNSIDSFSIHLMFSNNVTAELFLSYTAPHQFNVHITTTEELIEYDGMQLCIRGPRETYDSNGLFASAPVIKKEAFDLYADSLKASVHYFLNIANSGKTFPEEALEKSLLSTEYFLTIMTSIDTTNLKSKKVKIKATK